MTGTACNCGTTPHAPWCIGNPDPLTPCSDCEGRGYVLHANREPLMSEHYREFEVPCPQRCPRIRD